MTGSSPSWGAAAGGLSVRQNIWTGDTWRLIIILNIHLLRKKAFLLIDFPHLYLKDASELNNHSFDIHIWYLSESNLRTTLKLSDSSELDCLLSEKNLILMTPSYKKNSICTLSDIFCEPPLEGWSWSLLWSDLHADLGVEVSVSPVEGEVLVLCTEHSGARHYCCGSNCSPTAKYWEIFLTKREKEKAGEEEQSFFIQNIS